VFDRYLVHMFGGMIIEREFASSIERSGRLMALSSFFGGTEFREETDFDLDKFLKRSGDRIDRKDLKGLPPFTRYTADQISGEKSKKGGSSGSKGGGLAAAVDKLLEGARLDDSDHDPASDLKKVVEGAIKDMKGRDRELPVDVGLEVIASLLRRMFTSLQILQKTKKRNALDYAGWRSHIREMIFDLIALNLVKAEIISTWSDPAIFSWDELRVLRQRSLKREVTAALDLVDLLGRIYDTSRERIKALRSNMEIRRTIKALTSVRSVGDSSLKGTSGDVWNGRIKLRNEGSRADSTVTGSILLPAGNWQLISPKARGGDLIRDLGALVLPASGDMVIDMEVKPPGDFSGEARAFLYLCPVKTELEVEP
jgi:hypothetical protein